MKLPQIDSRTKILLIALLFVGGFLMVLLSKERRKDSPAAEEPNAVASIPEADLREEDGSKTGSYRRSGSIADHWDALAEAEEDYLPKEESPREARRPREVEVNDLFGEYNDPSVARDTPHSGGGGSRTRTERRADPGSAKENVDTAPEQKSMEPPQEQPRPQVKRSGAVSSLDEDLSSELGNGFSTLDGTDRWVGAEEGKPYACMFTRDEKVRSGQRISVRLLEDLVIGGVHVPRNTHLQGVVSISDRMEIAITSLDMGGRILTFHFEAYDTDGGKGIYCSDLSDAAKKATDQGLSTISSTLSSRLGRVARDAATVGASIIRNKAGEVTVSVPAGYTFYIIEEKRQ